MRTQATDARCNQTDGIRARLRVGHDRVLLRGGSAIAEVPAPGAGGTRTQIAEGHGEAVGLRGKERGRNGAGDGNGLAKSRANTADAGNHEANIIGTRLRVADRRVWVS